MPPELGPQEAQQELELTVKEGRASVARAISCLCAPVVVFRELWDIFFTAFVICKRSRWASQMRLASACRANHRNEIKPHKLVILKHSGRQFTMLTFFNFINICTKGEGRIHALTVWLLIFCLRDVFVSPPFYLPVALTQLLLNSVLISPCCDSSLALHGTWDSFNSYFPPAVSCKIRLLCLGERVESFLNVFFSFEAKALERQLNCF